MKTSVLFTEKWINCPNEMVSLGIQPLVSTYCNCHWRWWCSFRGGGVLESQNLKCQDLPKFQFLKRGGGGVLESQNPKCQDLPKFQFLKRGGGGVLESQNPKCQDLPKFQFLKGGGGVLESQNPKCQDLPKFQFSGGGVFWNQIPECSGEFGQKFLEACVLEA